MGIKRKLYIIPVYAKLVIWTCPALNLDVSILSFRDIKMKIWSWANMCLQIDLTAQLCKPALLSTTKPYSIAIRTLGVIHCFVKGPPELRKCTSITSVGKNLVLSIFMFQSCCDMILMCKSKLNTLMHLKKIVCFPTYWTLALFSYCPKLIFHHFGKKLGVKF